MTNFNETIRGLVSDLTERRDKAQLAIDALRQAYPEAFEDHQTWNNLRASAGIDPLPGYEPKLRKKPGPKPKNKGPSPHPVVKSNSGWQVNAARRDGFSCATCSVPGKAPMEFGTLDELNRHQTDVHGVRITAAL